MTINNNTAQLIFDALSWMDQQWVETTGMEYDNSEAQLEAMRTAFVAFCEERGIEYIAGA